MPCGTRQKQKKNIKFSIIMRKLTFVLAFLAMVSWCFTGCQSKNDKAHGGDSTLSHAGDTVADSTVYGVCGEGTAMHTVELITDAGDTVKYMIDEDSEGRQDVQGGLLVGDRLAIIEGTGLDGDKTAKKVINLTTLLGKWTSLDKNFEILEGGLVKSNVDAESHPWTSWKILNGQLLLNKDTFNIDQLSADSLYLENKEGIFVYKRTK